MWGRLKKVTIKESNPQPQSDSKQDSESLLKAPLIDHPSEEHQHQSRHGRPTPLPSRQPQYGSSWLTIVTKFRCHVMFFCLKQNMNHFFSFFHTKHKK